MPALPDVAGVFKHEMIFKLGDDVDVVNILHWSFSGGTPLISDCEHFADVWGTDFAAQFSGHLTSQLSLVESIVTDLTTTSSARGVFANNIGFVGTGLPLGAGSALLVNHQIARRYRGGKPRTYLAGVLAGDLISAQDLDPANVAIFQSDWDDFQAAAVAETSGLITIDDLVNVSYYQGFTVVVSGTTGRARNVPTLRVTPVVDPVVSSTINPRIASQRRRNLT
jgi:hypothetical protein